MMTDLVDKQGTEIVGVLLDLDDGAFETLVNNDTRHTEDRPRVSEEEREALRSPEVMRRWYSMILRMLKNIDGQFAAKTADHRAKVSGLKAAKRINWTVVRREEAEFEKWRAGALRVKAGLEVRLIEARYLLAVRGDTFDMDLALTDRNRALGRVGVLEEAIRRHRERTIGDDLEPSGADEQLWSYLSD